MCGLVGTLSFDPSRFAASESYIVKMRDTMIHRGPDGAGVWVSSDRRIGLGHRRLSIIDLSQAANQPMCNEDGTLWVVFNGEIYNHADIRRELERIGGHTWKTDHSDTEVIVHAFEQWGIDCIQRFRGMFAIALWDSRKRELWLIRDRIGIKPLYYSIHHNRIVFASEIKALLKDPEQARVVNEEAFFHYLSFLAVPAPATLFQGIHKLPGGTWLRVRADGRVEEHGYWDVLDHTEPMIGLSEQEIAERLLTELRTAVNLRKVSDVPVGVFLSGGIDSSTNTALFSEGETGPVKTFSIGYDVQYESYQNEFHYARLVADRFGAEHHEKLLNVNDLMDFLPQMVHLQDEPIGDPVCIPVYYVSKMARDNGIIVCHVGEGADELFIGYESWRKRYRAQLLDDLPVPRILKKGLLSAMAVAGMKGSFQYEYLRRGTCKEPIFWSGAEQFTQAEKDRLCSKRRINDIGIVSSWESLEPIRRRFLEAHNEPNALDWMSYVDLKFRLPELLLMRVDKMSMGASVEARVPFLDHKFVEFSMSIPPELKLKNGILKYMLKKAVRALIPDEIIDRPKQGFGVPIQEWLLGRLGDFARSELKSFCRHSDLISWSGIEPILRGEHQAKIWPLLNVALWWRKHFA